MTWRALAAAALLCSGCAGVVSSAAPSAPAPGPESVSENLAPAAPPIAEPPLPTEEIEQLLPEYRPLVTGVLADPLDLGQCRFGLVAWSRTNIPENWGREVEGIPDRPGGFTLRGVPSGRWTLSFVAQSGEQARYAYCSFTLARKPIDLGVLELVHHAGLRVRFLDAAGNPVPTGDVDLVGGRPSGASGGGLFRGRLGGHSGGRKQEPPSVDYYLSEAYYHDRPSLRVPEGWVSFPCLQPGANYRLTVQNYPWFRAEVETPDEDGASKDVEFRLPPRLVDCAIRFTEGGKEIPPSSLHAPHFTEGILDRRELPGDGVLRERLPPGRMIFGLQTWDEWGMGGRGSWNFVRGTVDIPDRDAFEATVDLE